MVRMPVFDPVEYLVSRRYPTWKIEIPGGNSLAGASTGQRRAPRDKALAYEQELRRKTPAEIQELLRAEQAVEAEERRRKEEAEENRRFFNSPAAKADFSHWGKLSYWTLDEAVALSFGRAPEQVNWKTVEYHANVSPFALQYKRRRELAIRAKATSELYDPANPGFFITWAKRLELDFPADLEAIVVARGEHIGDWKAAYEAANDARKQTLEWAESKITEILEQSKQDHARALEIGRTVVAGRDAEIERLREALNVAQSRNTLDNREVANAAPAGLGPRERDSMLRLIIGMAVKGYGYDPIAAKNRAVKEIADDLQTLGIGLDEDTVRKYLQEAKDLLPREAE